MCVIDIIYAWCWFETSIFFLFEGERGGWQVWCLWLLVFETPPCGRVWKKMGELGFMLSVERERERERERVAMLSTQKKRVFYFNNFFFFFFK